jgi:cysteine-rich repeat protein
MAEDVCHCGDNNVNQPWETCDGGDMGSTVCTSCRPPSDPYDPCTCCGDGIVQATSGEECDDGNTVNGDGCETDCTATPVCGDNEVNRPEETCDGTDDAVCTGDCRAPGTTDECTCCGDGVLQASSGEECDGVDDAACPGQCTANCTCPQACCFPDGTCQMLDVQACTDEGGEPQGSGTQCLGVEACCLPDNSCVMADALCCVNELNGVPQGAGTVCTQPEACCLPDNTCQMLDPLCCDDLGGVSVAGSCTTPEACCVPGDEGGMFC